MKKFNNLVLIGCAISMRLALADGANGSGGGAQSASEFHLRAQDLIRQISEESSADALCSAKILNQSLGETKIRMVDQLVDPQSGKPITDEHLDAYTSPGEMQLLKEKWDRYLNGPRTPWAHPVGSRRSIEVLILHEVYRSTHGQCDDENYKISDKIPFFLSRPNRLSKVMKFSARWFSQTNQYETMICTQPITESVKDVICAVLTDRGAYGGKMTISSNSFAKESKGLIWKTSRDLFSVPNQNDLFVRLQTLFSMTTKERSLFIVVDEWGKTSVGIDVDHLIALN